MVDNVSYEYMCFFLAGGLRTSEGNFLLHWRGRHCRGRCACREEKKWAAAAAAVWIEGLWSMCIEGCLFVLW